MGDNARSITDLLISLILTGMLLPMGILYLYTGQYVNVTVGGSTYTFGSVVDPILVTLLTVILPIIILIAVVRKHMNSAS